MEELKTKGVTEATLVWKNGLQDWVKANTLPEVMAALAAPVAPDPVTIAAQPVPPTPQPQPTPQPAQPAPAQQPQQVQQTYTQPAQPQPTAYEPQARQDLGVMPDDYTQKNLILAIVSFLCCGVLGAIFAILGYISGNEVKKMHMLGQQEMAAKKAAEAKKWFKVSIIVDAIIGVLFIIYFVVLFAFGMFTSY